MQDGLFPHLVVEKRNNDFAFIDVSDLDIFQNKSYNSFLSLDSLLKDFTEEEIKASIERANVVPDTNIKDKRLLIKYGNYKLPVLTKDISEEFDLYAFIALNYENKQITNIFYNKLAAIVKNDPRAEVFKKFLTDADAEGFINSLNWLSYVELREFFFYVYNEVAKKERISNSRLKREKD